METIAVTGVNGYIASSVTQRLLEEGFRVTGLSIEEKPFISHPNLKYIQVDLTNRLKVQSVIENNDIDVMLHFAAIAHRVKGQDVPDYIYTRVNYLASKNLFRCAYAKNIRIFFASTVDVYGACRESVWSEEIIPKPVGVYAKTKYMAERALQQIYGDRRDKYLIGRLAPVYSSDNMKDVYKRIYVKYPKLAITLKSNPSYDFLALGNLVHFISQWLKNPDALSGVINICDEKGITGSEFVRLERKLGRAGKIIGVPGVLASLVSIAANRLLQSESKGELGFALVKMFAPRPVDRTKVINAGLCNLSMKNIIYGDL